MMPAIYYTISIDVEPDCTPSWHYSNPLAFDGVHKGICKILQPLFNDLSVKPTYLINNVVLEDDDSVGSLQSLNGTFELGTHLHPEFMEPQKQFFDYAGKKGEANCCFFEPNIEFEKLRNITELFEKKFRYRPTSFRAGRFSAGINTMNSLRKLNYSVDSSVTPHVNWSDKTRERPVNYRDANEQPYWIKENSYLETASKEQRLLEVPVTIDLRKRWLIKERVSWLRPVYSSSRELKTVIDNHLRRYRNNKTVVLNMMFHNVEVMPGCSPYVQNALQRQQYLDQLRFFISYVSKLGAKSVGLSDLFQIFKG
jgi:hypothetical protein